MNQNVIMPLSIEYMYKCMHYKDTCSSSSKINV